MEYKINFSGIFIPDVLDRVKEYFVMARKNKGMSYTQTDKLLADRGSKKLVWQYENRNKEITLVSFLKLCALYKISFKILINEQMYIYDIDLNHDFTQISKNIIKMVFEYNDSSHNSLIKKAGMKYRKIQNVDNMLLSSFFKFSQVLNIKINLNTK